MMPKVSSRTKHSAIARRRFFETSNVARTQKILHRLQLISAVWCWVHVAAEPRSPLLLFVPGSGRSSQHSACRGGTSMPNISPPFISPASLRAGKGGEVASLPVQLAMALQAAEGHLRDSCRDRASED